MYRSFSQRMRVQIVESTPKHSDNLKRVKLQLNWPAKKGNICIHQKCGRALQMENVSAFQPGWECRLWKACQSTSVTSWNKWNCSRIGCFGPPGWIWEKFCGWKIFWHLARRLPSNAWHCSDNSSPKLSLAVLVAQELLSIRLSNCKCTVYPQQSPINSFASHNQ